MHGGTPAFPVFHHLSEFAQVQIHGISDAEIRGYEKIQ